jgi:acetyl esterase
LTDKQLPGETLKNKHYERVIIKRQNKQRTADLVKVTIGQLRKYSNREGIELEVLYYPASKPGAPLLVDIYGGGFISGSIYLEDNLCSRFNNAMDINVAAVSYRLAPCVEYPRGTYDVYDNIKGLIADKELAFDRNNIFIEGHSAGGYMTATVTLLSLQTQEFHVRGEILDYPLVDNSVEGLNLPHTRYGFPKFMIRNFHEAYFPDDSRSQESLASPLLASDDELKHLPPTLTITCGFDNLKFQAQKFHGRINSLGVDSSLICYEEAMHGFFEMCSRGENGMWFLPRSMRVKQFEYYDSAFQNICDFIQNTTK